MGLILVVLFIAILASLGVGVAFLLRSKPGSSRLVNALTVRIGLSVLLFALLMLAWHAGLIEPHGIRPLPEAPDTVPGRGFRGLRAP